MEPSTSTDRQPQNLVSVDVICYDEELEEKSTLQVLGNRPNIKVNLERIHYLTLKFNSTADVDTKYTEHELSTLIADMKPYAGVRLEFLKDSKVIRTNYSPSTLNMINVYKFDTLNVSLCSWDEMSQYFGKITSESFSSDDNDDESSGYETESDVTSESEEIDEDEEEEEME